MTLVTLGATHHQREGGAPAGGGVGDFEKYFQHFTQ